MPDNNKRKVLYEQLTKDGYDLGSYDSFSSNLNNETKRKNLYDAITADNYDVGDYNTFSRKLDENQEGSVVNQVIAEYDQSANQMTDPVARMHQLINENKKENRPSLRQKVKDMSVPSVPESPSVPSYSDMVGSEQRNYTPQIREPLKKDVAKELEEKELDVNFKAKPVAEDTDIFDNYMGRFGNTKRGIELNAELADVQSEFEKKYFDEFKRTSEYENILKGEYRTQEEADEANRNLNELFNQKYVETIKKEMAPYYAAYQEEMFDRYGYNINKEMLELNKKNTSSQINGLEKEVGRLLDEKHALLRRRGGSSGNAFNAIMGSGRYNFDSGVASQRQEIGALEASQRLLEQSQEIIAEAAKKGKTNFFGGFGRGLRDNFDWENFTFGLAEMADAKYLNNALEKAERGEALTSAEEKLLEASVANMATQAYFGSDLGRGYGAGQTTAVSLPFMLEFIANPISSSGNAIAKGLLKFGMKRFGRKAMEKGTSKFATRLLGDAVAAVGMEGTTGVPGVSAGTLERLNENYKYGFDDNGVMQVEKVGDKSFGSALAGSSASRFFENQSEMIFNAFKGWSPLMKAADNSLPGGVSEFMNRIKNSKVGTLYRELVSNPTFREIANRAQFHGLPEEYMEEVYNNLANAAIGEMSMDDVVDLDNNIDTFLGLAPTSVMFAAIGLGGMAYERLASRKRMERLFGHFTDEQKRKFEELQRMSKETGNRDIREFIKATMADESLSQEERRSEIEYAFELAKQNAIDEVQNEQPEEVQAAEAAYDEGTSMPPEQHYSAEQEKTMAGDALRNAEPGLFNVVNSILENGGKVEELKKMLTGASDEVGALALDYYYKAQRIEGVIDAGVEDALNAGDEFERSMQDAIVTDGNGNRTITTATYRDEQVYVLADDGVHATILRDGKKEMVGGDRLSDIQQSDADVVIDEAKKQYLQQKQKELENSINHHPKTQMPQVGMQLWSGDTPFVVTAVSPDGVVQALPSEFDSKTGQIVPKKEGMVNISIEEAKNLQDEYYNRMDAASVQAATAEDTIGGNVLEKNGENEGAPENVENKVSDESNVYILSDKTSDNGEPFYQDGSGNIDLAVIPQEVFDAIGKKAAPFRLIPSMLKHVFDRHGREMSLEDPQDAILFVLDVMDNFDHVRQGDKGALIFSIENGRSRTGRRAVTVLLDSKNGDYYGIKTSGYERIDGLQKRALLWEKGANETSATGVAPANVTTANAQQGNGQSGSASNQSNVLSESKDSEPSAEKQEGDVNNLIPVDEKGNPVYYKAPLEATVADLTDGTLTDEEVDGFVEANQKEAQSELKKITDKAPKIGTNKAKYVADKKAWQAKVDEAQAKVDYWGQVRNTIKEKRLLPGDKVAEEILAMGVPMDGNELAAEMLATGQLPLLREDYIRETGFGSNEASGMFGLFRSKENGGMSIEEAGERLMLADLEAGTGFFDQSDANAGRNALLDVLSSVKTRGGLTDYIKNNREAMAERERAAERAYEEEQREAWAQEHFGMSYADYVAYEDVIGEIIQEKAIPEEVVMEFYNNFADELNNIENGRTEEYVASDEPGANREGSERGEELLPSEQLGDNRGVETDASSEADERADNKGVPAQEEAGAEEVAVPSGSIEAANESRMNDISERLSEIDSRLIELEDVESDADDFAFAELVIERNELAKEKADLEAEYAGLEEMQRESEALRLEEEKTNQVRDHIVEEREKVDTNPTDAQKEAGNYKKGHVSVDGYNITIENPKGSERSGTDANGKKWSVTMNNDYGYIRGTEGVDGDHIDVFLSDNPTQGNVYVVDQINQETGEFDEHKVMYGFSSMDEATSAYLANYSPGWKGLGTISEVSKEEFKKWIESSHRKTKPFAEYKSVKVEAAQGENQVSVVPANEDIFQMAERAVNENKQKEKEFIPFSDFMQQGMQEKLPTEYDSLQAWKEESPETYSEEYDNLLPKYGEYLKDLSKKGSLQTIYDHSSVKQQKNIRDAFSDADLDYADYLNTKIERKRNPKSTKKDVTIKKGDRAIGRFFDGTVVSGIVEEVNQDGIQIRSERNGRIYNILPDKILNEEESDILFRESDEVNRKFNEQLSDFTIESADNFIFDLGHPSDILLSAGIRNLPIRLYGSKVAKKMKKHGFLKDELKDLPKAIASPIAVFDNIGREGNRSILTELQTSNGNFLVSIDLGKGIDADFDIVSSVFGKNSKGVINWINNGKLVYVDKKKAQNYLHLSAPIAEALDSSELSDATKIVESFENPSVADEKKTSDNRKVGVEEAVSLVRKFKETVPGSPEIAVISSEEDIDRLNVGEITKGELKRALNNPKVTGCYSNRAKMVFTFPSHASGVSDFEDTLSHEVAHYVSRSVELSEELKESVLEYVEEQHPDVYSKVMGYPETDRSEEAIAYLFEKKCREFGVDRVLKSKFAGDRDVANVFTEITKFLNHEKGRERNQLRGKERNQQTGNESSAGTENAVHDGRRVRGDDLFRESDTGGRGRIGAGERGEEETGSQTDFALREAATGIDANGREGVKSIEFNPATDNIIEFAERVVAFNSSRKSREEEDKEGMRFRMSESASPVSVPTIEAWDKLASSKAFLLRETAVDHLTAVEKFQDLIAERTKSEVKDYENAYQALLALSSKNREEMDRFESSIVAPLNKAIVQITGGKKKFKKWNWNEGTLRELVMYVEAKHGMERNEVMNAENETEGKDYSGLSSLFGDSTKYPDGWEKAAKDYVEQYEKSHKKEDVDGLWESIRRATGYALDKQLQSGLVGSEYVEKQLERFKYYIPLRGFADDIAEDVYGYANDGMRRGANPVKTAKGRESEAGNPFGSILEVGYSSISAGNKNLAKQRLYYFLLNHDTDGLTVVNRAWRIKPDELEKHKDLLVQYIPKPGEETPEWVEAVPNIPDNPKEGEVADIMRRFEELMGELKKKEVATEAYQKSKTNYKTLHNQRSEHQIPLMIGGNRSVITITGNPRLAQAVNGLLNPDTDEGIIAEYAKNVQRFMAGAFTSNNVAFALANLSKDTMYSNNQVFIKENGKYWLKFTKNQKLGFAELPQIMTLLYKYRNGKLDGSDEVARMFKEFMENGGATGYTFVGTQKEYSQKLEKELKKLAADRSKANPKEVLKGFFDLVEFSGQASELVNRFAAYRTSREMGRSVSRSVTDAKEITVNFNRKGAGRKTAQVGVGNMPLTVSVASALSQYGRTSMLFFNANMQAKYRMYKNLREHPVKTTATLIGNSMAFGGVIVPFINYMIIPALLGEGGDDDDYYNGLTDYERTHNICIRLKDGYWMKIPLSPEMQPWYSIGDMIGGAVMGKREMEVSDFPKSFVDAFTPVNVNWELEGGKFLLNFVPTVSQPIAQHVTNVNFMGSPLKKEDPWGIGEYDPEYKKVFNGTSPTLVELSRLSNRMGGGDDVKASEWLLTNWNPRVIQNYISGYTGGFGTTMLGVADIITSTMNEEEGKGKDFSISQTPVLSRFLISGDKDVKLRRLNSKFHEVRDFVKEFEHDRKGYKDAMSKYYSKGDMLEYAEYKTKLEKLYDEKAYMYEDLSEISKAVNDYNKYLKENPDDERSRDMLYELMLRGVKRMEDKE